jgi:hypothetical protein
MLVQKIQCQDFTWLFAPKPSGKGHCFFNGFYFLRFETLLHTHLSEAVAVKAKPCENKGD